MSRKPLIPCPLYCLRIARHLMMWIDEPSWMASDWWEVLHYYYSKQPLTTPP